MSSPASHIPFRSTDPRPARTRASILSAIQRINRADQELTVSSIVAEAGIARSSFYSQFTDIGDVAVQLIRDVYAEIHVVDVQHRTAGQGLTATSQSINLLIDAMAEHRNLYAAVLGANVSHEARREILRIMADGARPSVLSTSFAELDVETAVNYLASGVLGMLTAWVLSDSPLPTADIARHVLYMLPAWIQTNTNDEDTSDTGV